MTPGLPLPVPLVVPPGAGLLSEGTFGVAVVSQRPGWHVQSGSVPPSGGGAGKHPVGSPVGLVPASAFPVSCSSTAGTQC